jgi:hypothetical protein
MENHFSCICRCICNLTKAQLELLSFKSFLPFLVYLFLFLLNNKQLDNKYLLRQQQQQQLEENQLQVTYEATRARLKTTTIISTTSYLGYNNQKGD